MLDRSLLPVLIPFACRFYEYLLDDDAMKLDFEETFEANQRVRRALADAKAARRLLRSRRIIPEDIENIFDVAIGAPFEDEEQLKQIMDKAIALNFTPKISIVELKLFVMRGSAGSLYTFWFIFFLFYFSSFLFFVTIKSLIPKD